MSCSSLFSGTLFLGLPTMPCMRAADLVLRPATPTTAPLGTFSWSFKPLSLALLTLPAATLPSADWESEALIEGERFLLKRPALVGVVEMAARREVEEVEGRGERSLEADSSRGVERSFVAAANFRGSFARRGEPGLALGVGGLVLLSASTRSKTGEAGRAATAAAIALARVATHWRLVCSSPATSVRPPPSSPPFSLSSLL